MTGSHEVETEQKEFFDVKGLAKFLDISEQTVYRIVGRKSIPFYRFPRYIRFRRSDVDTYIERHLVAQSNEYERTKNAKHMVGGLQHSVCPLPQKKSGK
ncbi:MAG: helix-turn-helix domain-containing protein [Patescibacteria group bacterium]